MKFARSESASLDKILRREIGLLGAIMLGLGSIIGTGVFVSVAFAADSAGPSVVFAILVAAFVAMANGLSSAQLAANHPVSGGTYEYGYRWLNPSLGFLAGWMFLCAKSASASTAALGCAGYALDFFGGQWALLTIPLATAIVLVATLLVLSGIRRSSRANTIIVLLTLGSLVCFVAAGVPTLERQWRSLAETSLPPGGRQTTWSEFLEACALMFVAFTGYGRIATLGEEVVDPKRTIPRAVILTLIASSLLYISVASIVVAAAGTENATFAKDHLHAPLESLAKSFSIFPVSQIVAVGAMMAMFGVLLNLILGLSRVVLAMGRRADLPGSFARLDDSNSIPITAVIASGVVVAMLTLIGNVKTTWSFSAFTVLVYYAITNLAAIRLSRAERLYPRVISWLGLFSCLVLAFWVQPSVWLIGLVLILAGFVLRWFFRRRVHFVRTGQQEEH